jgi:predicted phage terminase large subunit-like protein
MKFELIEAPVITGEPPKKRKPRPVKPVLEVVKPEPRYLDFGYTKNQIPFFEDNHQFKVLCKGRRFGATHGCAKYAIEQMLSHPGIKILWVDVTYKRINVYWQSYLLPCLKDLQRQLGKPESFWQWRTVDHQLTIGDSMMDMGSADHPESLEGSGYGLIIMNEAGIILKNGTLWTVSIAPMALDHNASVIFAGTPKGRYNKKAKEYSLYYQLFLKGCKEDSSYDPKWKSWVFSTYDNELLSTEAIKTLTDEIPPSIQRQEIYAEFIDIENDPIFFEEWFEFVDEVPSGMVKSKIMSIDTAFKDNATSDYSAAVVIYQTSQAYYVTDCVNEKYEYPELEKAVQALYDRWRPDQVLIEDKASGQSIIQSLKRYTTLPVHPITPLGDKMNRAQAVTGICMNRKVKLVRGPWNREFLTELAIFPTGSDDIVDAFSQGMNYLKDLKVYQAPSFVTRKIEIRPQHLRGY